MSTGGAVLCEKQYQEKSIAKNSMQVVEFVKRVKNITYQAQQSLPYKLTNKFWNQQIVEALSSAQNQYSSGSTRFKNMERLVGLAEELYRNPNARDNRLLDDSLIDRFILSYALFISAKQAAAPFNPEQSYTDKFVARQALINKVFFNLDRIPSKISEFSNSELEYYIDLMRITFFFANSYEFSEMRSFELAINKVENAMEKQTTNLYAYMRENIRNLFSSVESRYRLQMHYQDKRDEGVLQSLSKSVFGIGDEQSFKRVNYTNFVSRDVLNQSIKEIKPRSEGFDAWVRSSIPSPFSEYNPL